MIIEVQLMLQHVMGIIYPIYACTHTHTSTPKVGVATINKVQKGAISAYTKH